MKVGAAKIELKMPEGYFPGENFTSAMMPVYVKTAIIQDEYPAAIISIEVTSLPGPETGEMRAMLERETGIAAEHIWITVTHTFSAPHMKPVEMAEREGDWQSIHFRKEVYAALKASVLQAQGKLQPAEVSMIQIPVDLNVNRDIESADGWWIGVGGTGPSNKIASALRFTGAGNQTLAVLFQYSIQSSVLDGAIMADGGKVISSDLAGVAAERIEKELDTVALFLCGAAGDQAPKEKAKFFRLDGEGHLEDVDLHEAGIDLCLRQGKALGNAVLSGLADSRRLTPALTMVCRRFAVPGKKMKRVYESQHPTRTFRYEPDGERELTVELLRIGEFGLVGVKPELNCETELAILALTEQPCAVVTMVNGAEKYLPDASAYDRFTYEAKSAPFAKGGAELLVEQVAELFREMGI